MTPQWNNEGKGWSQKSEILKPQNPGFWKSEIKTSTKKTRKKIIILKKVKKIPTVGYTIVGPTSLTGMKKKKCKIEHVFKK